MRQCKCGSYAINHSEHGRDGSDGDLCDVCYWRKRATYEQGRWDDALHDANDIFNSKPSETSQEVRDVIEWFKSSLAAASTQGKVGPT